MIHENDDHRESQDQLQWVLEYIGFRVEQTSTLCQWDFRLYRGGRLYAIVEYKGRSKLWDPLYVDSDKIRQLVHAGFELGAKPIFIVGENPPYHFVQPHTNYPTSMFKRKMDAERRGDIEREVFNIPASDFKIL